MKRINLATWIELTFVLGIWLAVSGWAFAQSPGSSGASGGANAGGSDSSDGRSTAPSSADSGGTNQQGSATDGSRTDDSSTTSDSADSGRDADRLPRGQAGREDRQFQGERNTDDNVERDDAANRARDDARRRETSRQRSRDDRDQGDDGRDNNQYDRDDDRLGDDDRRRRDRDDGEPRRTYDEDDSQSSDRRDADDGDSRMDGVSFEERDGRLRVGRLSNRSGFGRAGIRVGDVIIAVNGRGVSSRDAFFQSVRRVRPGQPVALLILRDGRRQTIQWDADAYTYADEPGSSDASDQGALGVLLDSRYRDAALVVEVYPDSPAEKAGLRKGDQILAINGRDVYSPGQVSSIVANLDPGTSVEIEFTRRVRQSTDIQLGSRDILREDELNPRDESFSDDDQPWDDAEWDDDRDDDDRDDDEDRVGRRSRRNAADDRFDNGD